MIRLAIDTGARPQEKRVDKLEEDKAYCHKCKSVTRWRRTRGKFLRCEGCKDRFPCQGSCKHLDCEEARNG